MRVRKGTTRFDANQSTVPFTLPFGPELQVTEIRRPEMFRKFALAVLAAGCDAAVRQGESHFREAVRRARCAKDGSEIEGLQR